MRTRIKVPSAEPVAHSQGKSLSFLSKKPAKKDTVAVSFFTSSSPKERLTRESLVRVNVWGKIIEVPYERALGAGFKIIGEIL